MSPRNHGGSSLVDAGHPAHVPDVASKVRLSQTCEWRRRPARNATRPTPSRASANTTSPATCAPVKARPLPFELVGPVAVEPETTNEAEAPVPSGAVTVSVCAPGGRPAVLNVIDRLPAASDTCVPRSIGF